MIFTLTTRTWGKKFLNNESVKDILFSQYVLVSAHIRHQNLLYDNIIVSAVLQPNSALMSLSTDQFLQRYPKQLKDDETRIHLATIVDTSIRGSNIVIMRTDDEEKVCPVLKAIANEITETFGYPVYDYNEFYEGNVVVLSDDKARDAEVCKKTRKYIAISEENLVNEELSTLEGRRAFLRRVSNGNVSKQVMAQVLKSRGLYESGMKRKEMIDMISTFV